MIINVLKKPDASMDVNSIVHGMDMACRGVILGADSITFVFPECDPNMDTEYQLAALFEDDLNVDLVILESLSVC
jgi:hypothetical protein